MPKQKPARKPASKVQTDGERKKKTSTAARLAKAPKISAKGAKKTNEREATAVAKKKLKAAPGEHPHSGDELDPEEAADALAASVEVDLDAVQDQIEEEPIIDRKEVKDLLAAGRQKGFLTYDEVNDALPADIVSSDQIDDVMSMFGDNEIEIVDAQKAAKASDT